MPVRSRHADHGYLRKAIDDLRADNPSAFVSLLPDEQEVAKLHFKSDRFFDRSASAKLSGTTQNFIIAKILQADAAQHFVEMMIRLQRTGITVSRMGFLRDTLLSDTLITDNPSFPGAQ